MKEMKRYQFIEHTKLGVVVHLEGCKDIRKDLQDGSSKMDLLDAENVSRAIQKECEILNQDFGQGVWKPEHFTIKPCCK